MSPALLPRLMLAAALMGLLSVAASAGARNREAPPAAEPCACAVAGPAASGR